MPLRALARVLSQRPPLKMFVPRAPPGRPLTCQTPLRAAAAQRLAAVVYRAVAAAVLQLVAVLQAGVSLVGLSRTLRPVCLQSAW